MTIAIVICATVCVVSVCMLLTVRMALRLAEGAEAAKIPDLTVEPISELHGRRNVLLRAAAELDATRFAQLRGGHDDYASKTEKRATALRLQAMELSREILRREKVR